MTPTAAIANLLALKPGDRLRCADGKLWHVRAVLEEDARVVVRAWYKSKRAWRYDVIAPSAIQVGLFVAVRS